MLYKRVIPCLLLKNQALVKTVKFRDPKYVGDPINTVRIFNNKEVDELIFLDIFASKENKKPPFDLIINISRECFMPFSYGGGIKSIEDVDKLFSIGVEKISLNSVLQTNPEFITKVANKYGSQSVIVSIDVKKDFFGKYKVYHHANNKISNDSPAEYLKHLQELGAGEVLLTAVNNDGMMKGYDIELVKMIVGSVSIPVVACGGAGNLKDIKEVLHIGNASAAALGSMVVYQGSNRAVLINFPKREEIDKIVNVS